MDLEHCFDLTPARLLGPRGNSRAISCARRSRKRCSDRGQTPSGLRRSRPPIPLLTSRCAPGRRAAIPSLPRSRRLGAPSHAGSPEPSLTHKNGQLCSYCVLRRRQKIGLSAQSCAAWHGKANSRGVLIQINVCLTACLRHVGLGVERLRQSAKNGERHLQ